MNTKNIFVLSLIAILSIITVQAFAANADGSFYSQGEIMQSSTISTSQPNTPVVQTNLPSNKEVMIMPGAASGGPNGPCVMANNCFSPGITTILPGDTVTWTNNDNVFHTITSGKPTDTQVGTLFDRSISPANSISIIFNSPEAINYFCKIHPWLVGKITVQTGSASNGTVSQNITNSQGNFSSSINPQNVLPSTNATLNQTQPLGATLSGLKSQADFKADMRKLWQDHIMWTRGFIISTVSDLGDTSAVTNRLLQNQQDIGNLIKPYYGNDTGNQLASLLKKHIVIAGEVVKAAKENKTDAISNAEKNWYANADQIAMFLAKTNPSNWPEQSMMDMLHQHLALTKQEVVDRLAGNWTGDINAFDEVQNQALEMSDNLSDGVIAQFPQEFTR